MFLGMGPTGSATHTQQTQLHSRINFDPPPPFAPIPQKNYQKQQKVVFHIGGDSPIKI